MFDNKDSPRNGRTSIRRSRHSTTFNHVESMFKTQNINKLEKQKELKLKFNNELYNLSSTRKLERYFEKKKENPIFID